MQKVSYLSIGKPFAIEDSLVALLESQVLQEGVLGLVDQISRGGHGSGDGERGPREGEKASEESHGSAVSSARLPGTSRETPLTGALARGLLEEFQGVFKGISPRGSCHFPV